MTVNMLGSHHVSRPSRTVAEWLWPFLPMGVAAFSLSALVYYHLRQSVFEVRSPLQQFYAGLYGTVGFAPAVMFFGLVIVWSTIWLVVGQIDRPGARLFRLVAMAIMLGVFLNLGDGGVSPALHKGALGAWLAETLVGAFGYWPSLLLVWGVTFASLLLATDFFFHESFERLRAPSKPDEAGVEVAVSDHLRGLGAAVSAPAPAKAEPAAGIVSTPDLGSASAAIAASAGAELAVPGAPERRRSYAERRAEREARSWRPPAEAEWVPAAPESQEIDNPESRSAGAAQSSGDVVEPAAAELDAPAGEPVTADEQAAAAEVLAALREAADVGGAGDAVEDVAASAAAAEDALPTFRLEPIVFPDEQVQGMPSVDEPSADRAFAHEVAPAGPRDLADPEEPAAPSVEPPWTASTFDEPTVAIPRPETPPVPPTFVPEASAAAEPPARQQRLFGASLDEGMVQDAIEVVTGSRRASVAFLQRKLRIDYELATEVLAELAARGVVALEGDATQGRVLG